MSHLKEAVTLSFTVDTPSTNTYELIFPSVTKFTFPSNMGSDSKGYTLTGTNPTTSIDYTVYEHIGAAQVGTIAISAAGAITFTTTSGNPYTIDVGDVVTIQAPSDLKTFTKPFGVSLVGER